MATIRDVIFDSRHPASIARFWAAAIDDYQVAPSDDAELARPRSIGINDPDDAPAVLVEPVTGRGPRLFFQLVPEARTVKNRVHLDLQAPDADAGPIGSPARRPHSGQARGLDHAGRPRRQ